ncbi:MAG: hypothetical protein AAF620_18520, partial [Bacteroidota bacterium]
PLGLCPECPRDKRYYDARDNFMDYEPTSYVSPNLNGNSWVHSIGRNTRVYERYQMWSDVHNLSLDEYAQKYGETYTNMNAYWRYYQEEQMVNGVQVKRPQLILSGQASSGYFPLERTYVRPGSPQANGGGSDLPGEIMAGGFLISGALLADDVTGVGVVDDVAIPFVIAGAAIGAGAVWLYENVDNPFGNPKDWTTSRGEAYNWPVQAEPTNPNDPKNWNNAPDKYWKAVGATWLGYELYDTWKKTIKPVPIKQDATHYYIPKPIIPGN